MLDLNGFWVVGGDTTRAWSAEAASYVEAWDSERTESIDTEQNLSALLMPYGLRGPYISPADIKNEAQRRIIALTGASDLQSCLIKQLNAQMRATELVNKRALGETLSEEEQAEVAALQALAEGIKAIRAASNDLETDPPHDFTDNSYWP